MRYEQGMNIRTVFRVMRICVCIINPALQCFKPGASHYFQNYPSLYNPQMALGLTQPAPADTWTTDAEITLAQGERTRLPSLTPAELFAWNSQ